MAVVTRQVYIANPAKKAGKAKRKRMAKPTKKKRKLSAKQIAAGFGGKRRQSNAKRKRKNRAARRSNRPKHRARTRPNPAPAPRKRRRNRRSGSSRRRKNSARKHKNAARKRNTGAIFALTGNPAKGHKMAKSRKRRKNRASSRSAGPRKRRNTGRRHHRTRRNPGEFGSPMTWLSGGAGVLTGVVATRGLPQLVLGASNTGPVGYLANAVATALTAFAAHMAFPRNKVFAGSVVAGGAAAILSRIITDYSLLGSYSSQVSSLSGMGDYVMNFNWPIPQYLQPGNTRAIQPPGSGGGQQIPLNMNSAAAVTGGSASGVSGYLY